VPFLLACCRISGGWVLLLPVVVVDSRMAVVVVVDFAVVVDRSIAAVVHLAVVAFVRRIAVVAFVVDRSTLDCRIDRISDCRFGRRVAVVGIRTCF